MSDMEFKQNYEIYKPELAKIYSNSLLQRIISTIKSYSEGADIRLVGGCVRDGLLNSYAHDIDLATNLEPEQVIKHLKDNNIKVIDTGSKFGTVTAVIDKKPYEITTLRKDIECYGRQAKVEYTNSFFEDACRRDFTINAMSYDLETGKLYDYFYGLEHLKQRQVIFIGSARQRIEEDYLRILRFFRFSSRFARALDETGFTACKTLKNGLNKLSRERINEEFAKLLDTPRYSYIIWECQKAGILELIFPGCSFNLAIINYFEEEKEFLDSVIGNSISFGYEFKLALLLFDPAKESYKDIFKSLKFSNKLIANILELHEAAGATDSELLIKLKRLKLKNAEYIHLLIFWFLANNSGKDYLAKLLKHMKEFSPKKLPIDGNKLKSMGYKGSEIGAKLKLLEKIWLENNCAITYEELIKHLQD